MSTILVNNIKSYTGNTVTISGSNILVTGNTTLGDQNGVDSVAIYGPLSASAISSSGNISAMNITSEYYYGYGGTLSGIVEAIPSSFTASFAVTSSNVLFGNITAITSSTSAGNITALGKISASGNLYALVTANNTSSAFKTVMYDTTTGKFHHTGSYGGGSGGGGATFPFTGSATISGSLTIIDNTTPGAVTTRTGLKVSGSNILFDYGLLGGRVTLGQHNVGNEIGSLLPITGSGLIISQSFPSEEHKYHNMLKIGETELVDISGSVTSDAFLINVRDKSLVISSSGLNKPVVEIANASHKFYNGDAIALSITASQTDITNTSVNILGSYITLSSSLGQASPQGGITLALPVTASGNISSSIYSTASFGSMILKTLPQTKPTITGSLWLSGSAGSNSKYLVVFTG